MNFKIKFKIALVGATVLLLFFLDMGIGGLAFLWLLILLTSFNKMSNHLISLLMTLEIFSLVGLLVASGLSKLNGSLGFIFVLMTLRVGEGVLGLAILVKFVRENNSELTTTFSL